MIATLLVGCALPDNAALQSVQTPVVSCGAGSVPPGAAHYALASGRQTSDTQHAAEDHIDHYGGCDVRRLIPGHFRLAEVVSGDVDGDDREDLLVISQARSPMPTPPRGTSSQIERQGSAPAREENLNGYRLTIARPRQDGPDCEIVATDESLIPAREHRNFEDAFDGAEIHDGVIVIKLRFFMGMGSWRAETRTLRFRRDGRGFRLIGVDSTEWMRNSGEMTKRSVNYLTGRMRTETGNMGDEGEGQVRWSRLAPTSPAYFGQMGAGLSYPLPGDVQ
ncbi:hypothetical protein JQK15_20055 [Sphingobium sp. BHU LFT2]|uniref:hypothetical protein n=1 Tax=Sphingobium sp. BHU LFT2 TaxID=2807634 RepID=UPI001BE7437E|nr:hypothetical protein [Sphingobium sp. BHU LFT2]MBT2245811.1 hypothetical protein [Sphingobium sp. BHU LFT2]